ncbi:CS1-pili formation C-terminal domain-containing protein [Candidatus Williamhamiltonella defendens]|uniref:CS1-pili formation C-terminal domain-containing protein n=1 Tax=Candidatus Williamhamiltonella defendens TaxID=138072 RepID=UPI00130D9755|nr:CS1-pili formation C-terminal domain-containing protein [Candidatus Hamiltonella defensa]
MGKEQDLVYGQRGYDVQCFPEHHSVQMHLGRRQYLKVQATNTFTLLGMLKDKQGNVLQNRHVSSDVAGAMINADGVLTLDFGVLNRFLTVREKEGHPNIQCSPSSAIEKKKQIYFIKTVLYRAVSVGEEKS